MIRSDSRSRKRRFWQFLLFKALMYLTIILLISDLFRPIYLVVDRKIYLGNKILYLMIHADYEDSVHCRKKQNGVNFFFCKVVTFISRINHERKHFIV